MDAKNMEANRNKYVHNPTTQILQDFIREVESKNKIAYGDFTKKEKSSRVNEDINIIQADRERIKNEASRQDIALKKNTLEKLFNFLTYETIIIFLFSFFQAIIWPFGFHLEEWSFKILTTVTITQITVMLLVAVKHLFPDQNKK